MVIIRKARFISILSGDLHLLNPDDIIGIDVVNVNERFDDLTWRPEIVRDLMKMAVAGPKIAVGGQFFIGKRPVPRYLPLPELVGVKFLK